MDSDRHELVSPISSSSNVDNDARSDIQPSITPLFEQETNKSTETKLYKKSNDAEKFRQSLKYHDTDSYVSQRDHKLGIGLFNTDEIADLPPRHQKKVLKAYEGLKAYENELHKLHSEIISVSSISPPMAAVCDESNRNCSSQIESSSDKHSNRNHFENDAKRLGQTVNSNGNIAHSSHSENRLLRKELSNNPTFSNELQQLDSENSPSSNKHYETYNRTYSNKGDSTLGKEAHFSSKKTTKQRNLREDQQLDENRRGFPRKRNESCSSDNYCPGLKDKNSGSKHHRTNPTTEQNQYLSCNQDDRSKVNSDQFKSNKHNFQGNIHSNKYQSLSEHRIANKDRHDKIQHPSSSNEFPGETHFNSPSSNKSSHKKNHISEKVLVKKPNSLTFTNSNRRLEFDQYSSGSENNCNSNRYQKVNQKQTYREEQDIKSFEETNAHIDTKFKEKHENFDRKFDSCKEDYSQHDQKSYPSSNQAFGNKVNSSPCKSNKNNFQRSGGKHLPKDQLLADHSVTNEHKQCLPSDQRFLKETSSSSIISNKNTAHSSHHENHLFEENLRKQPSRNSNRRSDSDPQSPVSKNNYSSKKYQKVNHKETNINEQNMKSFKTPNDHINAKFKEKRGHFDKEFNLPEEDSSQHYQSSSSSCNQRFGNKINSNRNNFQRSSVEKQLPKDQLLDDHSGTNKNRNDQIQYSQSSKEYSKKTVSNSCGSNKNIAQSCHNESNLSNEQLFKKSPSPKTSYRQSNHSRHSSVSESNCNPYKVHKSHQKQPYLEKHYKISCEETNACSDNKFNNAFKEESFRPRNKIHSLKNSVSELSDKSVENEHNQDRFQLMNREFKNESSSNSQSTIHSTVPFKTRLDITSRDFYSSLMEVAKLNSDRETRIDPASIKIVREVGFFLKIVVSESSANLDLWKLFFDKLNLDYLTVVYCCEFVQSLVLDFKTNRDAVNARRTILRSKHKNKDLTKPHIVSLSDVKRHLIKPCKCELDISKHCMTYFAEFSCKYVTAHEAKINAIIDELNSRNISKENSLNLKDALDTQRAMGTVFQSYVRNSLSAVKNIMNLSDLRQLKLQFSRECNSFERGLPIYSQKDVILNTIRSHPVSVIVAETGSGKSTQLTQYLLHSSLVEKGSIICTQPRKLAAISIANYVCTQVGSSVGKEVGYDVGIEKKCDLSTKIIYMTDYSLLRKCLRNKYLKGISCIIIDEAHERTLYTDLLLGLLKQCLESRQDLRIIITSATINPSVFVRYFNLPDGAVIRVPGRVYPVKVNWLEKSVTDGFMYVRECVNTAYRVHRNNPLGDILVFLTSPAEIDEAILLFQEMCSNESMPQLMSLHGKSDLKDQLQMFETSTNKKRRVIFATNAAETSLTLPGIKYVIDSGMAKEMIFYPEKNKCCLMPTLINKSSAEQRKGRAGRTQPGVCYRMYSKQDYENMPERALPELLKTDLLNALLKVYEFGIKPSSFDFVESPSKEAIRSAVDSLEVLELIENNELTSLGKQVVQLSMEPRLAKFILLGVKCNIGHEAAIIAALVSEAGRIFLRFDDNKEAADRRKKVFCQASGDLCTFLEVYKRWLEVSKPERFDWCVSNYISSKALHSAHKTVQETLIILRQELGIAVSKRYNNLAFKKNFEDVIFRSFNENLCIYSGHQSLGYQSPNFKESLFIHPSSSLKHLRIEPPKFLLYTVFMETSRNFILDVTPLKEETVNKAHVKDNYYMLSIDSLKKLQIPPVTLGPFGEKTLSRYILGRNGYVINDLERLIKDLINSKNFRLDIHRDTGLIIVHVEEKFHEKVTNYLKDIVKDAHTDMAKEIDFIKMEEGFSYFCLSSGGLVLDIILPGEFMEINIEPIDRKTVEELKSLLKKAGHIQSLKINSLKHTKCSINVIYRTVADAKTALKRLNDHKIKGVKERNIIHGFNKSSKPLYRLRFVWPRLLSKGTGYIGFSSIEDCVMVSGHLSTKSLYVENSRIQISNSESGTYLCLKNLPQSANKRVLKEEIDTLLPDFLRKLVTGVQINRMESLAVAENEIIKIKDELSQNLCRFSPASKFVIDVVHPKPKYKNHEAVAYFECSEDGKKTFQELKSRLKINNIPVDIFELLQSHIKCKGYVYDHLEKDIKNVIKKLNGEVNVIKSNPHHAEVVINFSSQSIEDLYIIIKELLKVVQGRKMECSGNYKYFYLFTESGKRRLNEIQSITKTLIECDFKKKIVFIYGCSENCYRAEAEIHSLIQRSKLMKIKTFDLRSSSIPSGFLKELHSKYGLDLFGLIRKFDLKTANIDRKFGNLTIEGETSKLQKVEEHLEDICTKLHATNSKKADDDFGFGNCAICLDPVQFDFYRLEHCGHSFCKSCLLLQLESKIIPVTCAQESCGKEFFLIDINRILSLGGENLRREFHTASLQYHVSTHSGKISYCPTPDCPTVYRVSSTQEVEFHCPGCSNDICTHCRTFSHKGMSCDIFQNSKTDEDYSLKVWMRENVSSRKQCPQCRAVIEKIEGCNHMECANCKSHLCWLCLKIFDSGALVYDHLPFCPKNQVQDS